MRRFVLVAATMLALGAVPGAAKARPGGCLKYGLGGAVVGHFAGGHRWKGAALGCALGIYQRRQYEAARRRELGRGRTVERRYDDTLSPTVRDRPRTFDRDVTGSTGGFGRGGSY